MTPTIGRIVRYHFSASEASGVNNVEREAPAIITRVLDEKTVNLTVFCDGESNLWKSSVVEGTGDHQWSWPPIEKPAKKSKG